MPASRTEMTEEAVRRMKKLGIFAPTIRQFEKEDLVSESTPPLGACFWLNDEQKKRVKKFELEHGVLVYHVIHSYTNLGEMESYLFVTSTYDEWLQDDSCFDNQEAFAYVYNNDEPDFSEFGYIGIQLSPAAGLLRTW